MDGAYALMLGLIACESNPLLPSAQLATEVVDAIGHTGDGFHDAWLATNGVRGGGLHQGSRDVFSLPLHTPRALVLAFDEPVFDREGADLVVFENPFEGFIDPVVVEVSVDCEAFVAFPHALLADGFTTDPAAWPGFAGLTPVRRHEEAFPIDPFDPEAGGDTFDLVALADDPAFADLLDHGVRCVALSSAASAIDPLTEQAFPMDPISNGADIDGVYGSL